ncbi:SseB family protein, partial [Rhodanobacter sp. FW104-R8]
IVGAEQVFYKALLEATVYAHVPIEPAPSDRIRFIQFIRPDNGQTVLPFFSEREQAEVAAAGRVAIMAMAGRRLFELTRGATLMLNPNRDQLTFYPPEVGALLEGRPLGAFTKETLGANEQVGACPPSVSTDALVLVLRGLYEREPSVRAGYLVEVHRGSDNSDVFLLLTLVVTKGNDERMVQLTSLELSSVPPPLALPVTMTCVLPDEPLPELCHCGIQFYGT